MSVPAVKHQAVAPLEDRLRTRILIVDDDERNAFAAIQALETLGQELVVARSGEEALRHLLTDDFAVILLDLHMPGMDGYETAELIRQRRRNRDVPIVFLTAVFRDEAHIFKAYSAGAVDVVFKPVDPFILRSKVQVLVDLHIKTLELEQQSESRRLLIEENARIHAEKLAAERALRRTQERQEAILRALPVVFHSRTADAPYEPLFVGGNVMELTGFSAEDFLATADFGISRVHPDDVDIVARAQAEARKSGAYACEYRWRCADGSYRSLIDQGVLAQDEESGRAVVFGTLLDNTERRGLEEQLSHARKMEAVGQLTGGVAHDFNNLLTVVLGNIELIKRRTGEQHELARQIEAVRLAAEKGGALTRQLLAFSRRQRLNPLTVDLNGLIADFAPLLRQAVGEAVSIDLNLATEPLPAHLDPAQFESALLNLAVNARDAMEGGGVLSIATRTVDGDAPRILVTVRDTGQGMDADVASRIFEPFFTTKEIGKGSGLGLSQVYGFVRQSGGEVSVRSSPGQGAIFEISLPRSLSAPGPRGLGGEPGEAVGGSERVLVVEDDPAVLAMAVETLEGLGYQVTTADTAAAALKRLKGRKTFDLLFSDVVMPGGVNGVQLAHLALQERPGLKVLLTSGYVGDEAASWANEFPMIDKPYLGPALAAKIRAVLDADALATEEPRLRQG
ncbi:signal transduction histidine kinase/CheY-like chemotaxis protein [Caulobacter rhizosphaerae]|uniref:histidine kinase n=1 Tax=Caulobacter rhizosphaerae TaxID=2010972 RepID=A0ABU1N5J1_9CAUL|nr:response regulator [Caulobacter rhizosphaerae]MDR6533366.1 signal transduction histidine kinase/CheY-like chemotaxis protein [Caulobacter rhizosphaerae]